MNDKKYSVGERFCLLRKIKGRKQEELARILNIDTKTLSKIENNEVQPKVDLIEKFVAAINISIEDFFRFSENNIFHNNIHDSTQFEVNNTKVCYDENVINKLIEEKDNRRKDKDTLILNLSQRIYQLEQELIASKNKLR
ncbi:MAG: helix-turn-helix transcriptional regulator [Saprospiraceae bacterium]|nr:helix-turn-helix transcriptional regulator [Saprospiraceae bacterium]